MIVNVRVTDGKGGLAETGFVVLVTRDKDAPEKRSVHYLNLGAAAPRGSFAERAFETALEAIAEVVTVMRLGDPSSATASALPITIDGYHSSGLWFELDFRVDAAPTAS